MSNVARGIPGSAVTVALEGRPDDGQCRDAVSVSEKHSGMFARSPQPIRLGPRVGEIPE